MPGMFDQAWSNHLLSSSVRVTPGMLASADAMASGDGVTPDSGWLILGDVTVPRKRC